MLESSFYTDNTRPGWVYNTPIGYTAVLTVVNGRLVVSGSSVLTIRMTDLSILALSSVTSNSLIVFYTYNRSSVLCTWFVSVDLHVR
jgi:hypothetical protein